MRVELLEGQTKIFTQAEGGRERGIGGELFHSQSIVISLSFCITGRFKNNCYFITFVNHLNSCSVY